VGSWGNLHDETDGFRMPKGFVGAGLSRSVQSLGTTAPEAESLRNLVGPPEWSADLEYVWRTRVADLVKSFQARARRRRRAADRAKARGEFARAVGFLRSGEWADERARALAMSRGDVVATCGQRWRTVKCGCSSVDLRVGCDNPTLCEACRKRHSRKWRSRITAAMDAALVEERRAYYATPAYRRRGFRPGIYLITVTAPHSGDLVTDRESMGDAVRALLKHANKYGWWRTYALTWEATAGGDGKGHMHAHLAVISSWVPYSSSDALAGTPDAYTPRRRGERRPVIRGLHEVWRDAMPGALVLDVQAPRSGADGASTAGEYLAKYVTKGVDPSEFSGRKAGELLVAMRGKRKVSTSAHFWQRPLSCCEHCARPWRSSGAPESLQDIAPGAVLRSMSERARCRGRVNSAGAWVPRGGIQVLVRWDGS
jgi:hypothetical protein